MKIAEWFYNYCAARDVLYNKEESRWIELRYWFNGEFRLQKFDSLEYAKQFVDYMVTDKERNG